MTDRKHVFRGDRLKEVRIRHGLSQQELCGRLGFPQAQLTRYETNKADPSAEILLRMANELGVTTDWLLGRTDIPDDHFQASDFSGQELRLISAFRRKDFKEMMVVATDDSPL